LWGSTGEANLENVMSPRSLLFSSDQETSRQVSRVLQDLNFTVATCPEIFAALRTLTSTAFEVVIVDWDEGLEASFLLKTARESRSHQNCFAIVVGNGSARAALEQAGADLVLSKPLQSDRTRHALLNCDAFVQRQRRALPQSLPTMTTALRLAAASNPRPQAKAVPGWPVPASSTPAKAAAEPKAPAEVPPVHLTFATLDGGLAGKSVFKRQIFNRSSKRSSRPARATGAALALAARRRNWLLRSAVIGIIFFAVGYIFSQPLSEMSAAIAGVGRSSWRSTGSGQQNSPEETQAAVIPAPEAAAESRPGEHSNSSRIRVVAVRNSSLDAPQTVTDMPQPIAQAAALQEAAPPTETDHAQAVPARRASVPESISAPFPGVSAAREVAAKLKPALMEAWQPVNLPGELSEKLLLEKIVPSYPEKALQAGLRGPVVLQAWIGKDGRIQELKLIRGPLLLGQAAFDAVRNWRYKPYLLNGEAVEAQTQVTVDFKLP
jgi:TonB family protein